MSQFPPLLILCWNTRSLKQLAKREAVLRQAQKEKADIIFLQEAHATELQCHQPSRWLSPTFAATFEVILSKYCAIIIKKNLFSSIETISKVDRVIHATVTLQQPIPAEFENIVDKTLNLICIYANAGQKDRIEFFDNSLLWSSIPDDPTFSSHEGGQYLPNSGNNSPFTIMAGDFNDFPRFNDSPIGDPISVLQRRHWWKVIDPLMQQKGLVDPLNEPVSILHHITPTQDNDSELDDEPIIPQFYTRTTESSTTRIDHILLSRSLGRVFESKAESYFVKADSVLSDHSKLFLRLGNLSTPSEADTNPQMQQQWRLPSHWCLNDKFLQKMRAVKPPETISEGENEPAWVKWNVFKGVIIESAKKWVRILSSLSPHEHNFETDLRKAGARVDYLVQSQLVGSQQFSEARQQLRNLEHILLEKIRKTYKDNSEAIEELPRKWTVPQLLFRKQAERIISLKNDDSQSETSWEEMEKIIRCFYKKLYSEPTIDYDAVNEILHSTQRQKVLTKEQCCALRAVITEEEIEDAINRMNKKSVPGEDGLPLAIYETLPEVRKALAEYGTALLTTSESAQPNTPNILVSLLFKKGQKDLIANYRPVSLINICDRILTNVLNWRFQISKAAHQILPPAQHAFVADRHISEAILTMQLFISANLLGLTKKTQAVVLLDQEKAFDRLSPAFMARSLRWYGVPSQIIQFLKKTAAEANSRYKLNGNVTHQVDLRCGIMQGDPLAPLTYNIGTQPFIDAFKARNIVFQYVTAKSQVNGNESADLNIMWPQFADDWSPVITHENITSMLHVLDLMKKSANISINKSKTQMFFLHPSDVPNEEYERKEADYNTLPYQKACHTEEIRYLGAYIRADGKSCVVSHQKILENAQRSMHIWKSLSSSWLGAVRLVNTFFTSKLWFQLGSAGFVDTKQISHELYRNICTIVFGRPIAYISLNTLAMPRRHGGLALVAPRHMLPAMAGQDLANGLTPDNTLQCVGTLFRECLKASSYSINEDEGVWLERRGIGWRSGRLRHFQPMWLRFALAASRLNLSVDPVVVQNILDLPWWTHDTDPQWTFCAQDRSWLRRGGIRSWNDMLIMAPCMEDIEIYDLDSVMRVLALEETNIPGLQKQASRHAWKILHSKWQQFKSALPEKWRIRLTEECKSTRRSTSPRWMMTSTRWPKISLPQELILAGKPLQQYSIKSGRRYLLLKEAPQRKIPRRIQALIKANTQDVARADDANAEEEQEIDIFDNEEALLNLLPSEHRAQFSLNRNLDNQPDFYSPSTTSTATTELMLQVDQFWLQLVTTKRILKMTPSIYSSIYAAYHGSLPTPTDIEGPIVCCQSQHGSRLHKLHQCIRAKAIWKHMNGKASALNLDLAEYEDQNECTELFPKWRGSIVEKMELTTEESDIRQRCCLKMLLISTHIQALMLFMNHPVEPQDADACIARVRRIMADYPILDGPRSSTA